MRKLIVGVTALLLTAGAGIVKADGFDADAGLGYSRLRIDGPNAKDLDKSDGAAVHAEALWNQPAVPGLRLGFSLDAAGYINDFHETDNTGDERHRFHSLSLLVPELRAAYRIPIDHFFIEPSIGVGAALADYQIGTYRHHHHHDDDNDFAQDDDDIFRANVAVQPSLKIGYQQNRWSVGVEASYLYTHLHFQDGVGGDVSEMYVGGFFRWSF